MNSSEVNMSIQSSALSCRQLPKNVADNHSIHWIINYRRSHPHGMRLVCYLCEPQHADASMGGTGFERHAGIMSNDVTEALLRRHTARVSPPDASHDEHGNDRRDDNASEGDTGARDTVSRSDGQADFHEMSFMVRATSPTSRQSDAS
jgi:hypothetical protein